jgi:hypothetical protein
MNYSMSVVGRVVLLRWHGAPQMRDAEAFERAFRDAQARLGPRLFLCSLVSAATDPPAADVRAHMIQRSRLLIESGASIHVVFDGTSLKASLLRTLVRGMILAGRFGDQIGVHDSLAAFLARVGSAAGASLDELTRQADGSQALG